MQRLMISLAAVLVAATCPDSASAQTLLRWKLKPGETLKIEIHQDTDSQVGFSGKSAATKIELGLQLVWKVTAAAGDSFTVRQTVEHIREKLVTQDMGIIEFDSSATTRPSGQARELAEAIKPLVGAEFELAMTPSGEITSATPANDIAKSLLTAPDKTNQSAAAQEGLQQMLRRPLVILPDKPVSPNDTWTVTSDRATAAGMLKLDTTYQMEGLDNHSIAKVASTSKAQAAPGSKANVKQYQHSGTILFSVEDGRPVEIKQTQKLVTERPYRETTITVTLSSTQTTTIQPK
jgi:hypothetical protein